MTTPDKRIAITTGVSVEVRVADYAEAYGLSEEEVQSDALKHLSEIATEAVREAAERLGYVTEVKHVSTRVDVTRYQ